MTDLIRRDYQSVIRRDANRGDSSRMNCFNVDQAAICSCENFELTRTVTDYNELAVGAERHAWNFDIYTRLQLSDDFSLIDVPVRDTTVQTRVSSCLLVSLYCMERMPVTMSPFGLRVGGESI